MFSVIGVKYVGFVHMYHPILTNKKTLGEKVKWEFLIHICSLLKQALKCLSAGHTLFTYLLLLGQEQNEMLCAAPIFSLFFPLQVICFPWGQKGTLILLIFPVFCFTYFWFIHLKWWQYLNSKVFISLLSPVDTKRK